MLGAVVVSVLLLRQLSAHQSITLLASRTREVMRLNGKDTCIEPAANVQPAVGDDGGRTCQWGEVVGRTGTRTPMCLRNYSDLVSDEVKSTNQWHDCPPLEDWWTYLPDRSANLTITKAFAPCGATQAPSNKMFIDIGSNVGACTLPMAARDDVEMALAFEMNPQTFFYLHSSILGTPAIAMKTYLYPYGLGEVAMQDEIFTEAGNIGNTVIGEPMAAEATGITVKVVPGSAIFQKPYPYIHLMKMDAQGYEVKILKGAEDLFSSGNVNAIKFELAPEWLIAQGTSGEEFLNTFLHMGFEIFDAGEAKLLEADELRNWFCAPSLLADFMAVHVDPGESPRQAELHCSS